MPDNAERIDSIAIKLNQKNYYEETPTGTRKVPEWLF
jgi:hypothetical protein